MTGGIPQLWHGWPTRPGLAEARNERPSWPLQKVWPGGQRFQVMHDELPTRSITGGDVGGGDGAEVHGCGRFVPGVTLKADYMPRLWS